MSTVRVVRYGAAFVALAMVAVGLCIGRNVLGGLSLGEVWGYLGHGQVSDPLRVADRLVSVVAAGGFVWAYGLVLFGSAVLFRLKACSRMGCRLATFVVMAVVVTVVADLVARQLYSVRTGAGLGTAIEAATATRWCALFVALIAIPAVVGIAARLGWAWLRAAWWRCRQNHPLLRIVLLPTTFRFAGWLGAGLSGSASEVQKVELPREPADGSGDDGEAASARERAAKSTQWWDDVLVGPEVPTQTDPSADIVESSWLSSYNVPGAQRVVDQRAADGRPVQGLCLSGGGVRSACVAMGAMQVLAKDNPELIDEVDYIVSVSGGGYTAGARLLAALSAPTPPANWRERLAVWRKRFARAQPEPPKPAVESSISARFQEGSAEFDYLRRHSSYISDSPAGLVRALLEILKNVLASLVMILTIPVIAGWAAGYALARIPIAAFPPVPNAPSGQPDQFQSLLPHPGSYWAIGVFAVVSVVFLLAALMAEWAWWGRCRRPGAQCVLLRRLGEYCFRWCDRCDHRGFAGTDEPVLGGDSIQSP